MGNSSSTRCAEAAEDHGVHCSFPSSDKSPEDRVEGPACSGEHRASGRTRLGKLSSGRASGVQQKWRPPATILHGPLLILLGLARIRGCHCLDFCLFFDGHRGRQQKERSRKVMCLHWGYGREL